MIRRLWGIFVPLENGTKTNTTSQSTSSVDDRGISENFAFVQVFSPRETVEIKALIDRSSGYHSIQRPLGLREKEKSKNKRTEDRRTIYFYGCTT